jgi:2-polyprenyl-3-methyl-5-hydroxy-6-metoxy-1,4-benzoquinol methylase
MSTTTIKPQGYETKPVDYFGVERQEMLPFVPAYCRRVLDVGCGAGAFGELLKQTRKIEVWGVEPVTTAALKASAKLDRVINSPFGPETDLPAGTFDCVVFNDVLEHSFAPEEALRYAKSLLSPVGAILASIPNIRNFPILWNLLFHGRWEYTDCGLLDKTHLRFFTKSSIVRMFQDEGYSLQSICGINAYVGLPNASRSLWSAYKLANTLFLGKFADMKFQQFAVVAKAAPPL